MYSREFLLKLHKLVFLMDKIADNLVRSKLDLTLSQFLILNATDSCCQLTQKSIADYLGITQAAVSRHIEVMVAKKFVARKTNSKNRRENMLMLTPRGQDYLKKAGTIISAEFMRCFKNLPQSFQISALAALDPYLHEVEKYVGGK